MESFIHLKALDPPRIQRFYSVYLLPTLFGWWILRIHYGREGFQGRWVSYDVDKPLDAVALMKKKIKRRLSSLKRLGVNYHITEGYVHEDLWDRLDLNISRHCIVSGDGQNYRLTHQLSIRKNP